VSRSQFRVFTIKSDEFVQQGQDDQVRQTQAATPNKPEFGKPSGLRYPFKISWQPTRFINLRSASTAMRMPVHR
jgi:hypothetical protein